MQSEHRQTDANNPQPFLIWKNARKDIQRQQRRRKQSFQYPVTTKKQRKMTIEVSRPSFELEDLPSFKSLQSDRAIEEEQDQLEQHKEDDFYGNMSEVKEEHDNEDICKKIVEEVVLERENNYSQQYQEYHDDVEENIPFDCHEWELDKETPYLKNCSMMQEQMDELRIDS